MADEVENLLARCLELAETGSPAAIDALLAEHPEHAEDVRRRLAALRSFGMLDDGSGPTSGDGSAPYANTPPARLGPYHLHEEIGRGGQAVVFRATDERLDRVVALKLLPPTFDVSDHFLRRFRREASSAARLVHPGLCPVYESGVFDGVPFIAMRHVDGVSLADRIQSARDGDAAPFSVDEAIELVESVARATQVAHEAGLVHRDLKPGNIMVTPAGDPVLLDFGLVRDEEAVTLTQSDELLGTPPYMSPEQIRGEAFIDARTDVWSLGVTLHEMLTLDRTFSAATRHGIYRAVLENEPSAVRRVRRDAPASLGVVLATALAKDRDQRYATAADLADDLRRVRERRPVRARPPDVLARLAMWSRRNPWLALALTGLLVALTAGLITALVLLDRSEASFRRAEGLRLAAEARNLVEENPAEALRLAMRGHELHPGRLANEAMLAAMYRLREVRDLGGPGPAMFTAVLSPGGARAAGLCTDGRLRLWPLSGFEPRSLDVHAEGDRLLALAFASDERLLVSTAGSELLELDAGTGRLLGRRAFVQASRMRVEDGAVLGVAARSVLVLDLETWQPRLRFELDGPGTLADVSRDLKRVLRLDSDGAYILDAARKQVLVRLAGHDTPPVLGVFSPDGTRALTVSRTVMERVDDAARLFDATSGRLLHRLAGHEEHVLDAAFSPDGRRIATAGRDRRVILWDAASGARLDTLRGHAGRVFTARFSRNGRRVVSASFDGRVKVWTAAGHGPIATFRATAPVAPVVFEALDGTIAVASDDGTVRLWSLSSAERETILRHERTAYPVHFHPDGIHVLTASHDGTARLWDRRSGREVRRFAGHGATVFDASFDRRGDRVVTTCFDGACRLFDTHTGELIRRFDVGEGVQLLTAALSPSERRLVVGSQGGALRVFDVASGRALLEHDAGGRVLTAVFTADDDHVVIGAGFAFHLIAVDTGETLSRFPHNAEVYWGRVTADGTRLVTTSDDHSAAVWDLASGERLVHLTGHTGEVLNAVFSPDERLVATASLDGTARLWQVADGALIYETPRMSQGLYPIAFSPDGRWLAAGGFDGAVRLWPVVPYSEAASALPGIIR